MPSSLYSLLTSRGLAVADTTKLSVGTALEKLRGTEAPKAKMARLDEQIEILDEETQRLRAMRRQLGPERRASSSEPDAQTAGDSLGTKLKILIIIGILMVVAILAWGLL
jgi:hypothetical protein